jgi:hypothetical protein
MSRELGVIPELKGTHTRAVARGGLRLRLSSGAVEAALRHSITQAVRPYGGEGKADEIVRCHRPPLEVQPHQVLRSHATGSALLGSGTRVPCEVRRAASAEERPEMPNISRISSWNLINKHELGYTPTRRVML